MARFTGGWVKIHRRAMLGDINANFIRGGLFIALISMANLKRSTVVWRGKPRQLERGELVTSIGELADLGECDRKTVLRHLSYLELRKTISVEKCFGGTLIKIPNFDKYQAFDAEGSEVTPKSEDNDIPNDGTHSEEYKNIRTQQGASNSSKKFEFPLTEEGIRWLGALEELGLKTGMKSQVYEIAQHFETIEAFQTWLSELGEGGIQKVEGVGKRKQYLQKCIRNVMGLA